MSQAATETQDTPTPEADLENPTTDHTPDNGTEDGDGEGDNNPDPRVQRANRQAAQYRTQLRETEAKVGNLEQQVEQSTAVLDALRRAITGDAEGDPEADPADVAQQATARVTELETETRSLRNQLLVYELASDPAEGLNANPVALLDSRRFTDKVAALDASADDYRQQVAEAIRTAVESNSNLRAGQGSRRGGAETAGRSGEGTVTQEQFNDMTPAQRGELFQTNPTLYRQLADSEISSRRR